MGVAWQYIDILSKLKVFDIPGRSVLDIGSSNLYTASASDIVKFICKFNNNPQPDLTDFATRMEYGAAYDPIYGGRNGTFLGQVLEAAGFHYDAIDIADGYKTTIVDLNVQNIPVHMTSRYDVVINSGTTEHILNQYNSFKAIHDATKVGGYIWNSVPAVGYLDHGYFCYTGKFFFDLAKFNDYEVVDMWFDGPSGPESIFSSVQTVKELYIAASHRLDQIGSAARENLMAELQIPTVGISFVYRKIFDRPFMGTLETTTSVGDIPDTVMSMYKKSEGNASAALNHVHQDAGENDAAALLRWAFDESLYLQANPDAASYPYGPLQHYLNIGWKRGADPSRGFSTLGYLHANPDVAENGINPLLHYLKYGIVEGRVGHIVN